jgi:ribosomal protein S18 acetylase RimI-like enzyme
MPRVLPRISQIWPCPNIYAEEISSGVQEYTITLRHPYLNIGRLLIYVYGGACQLKTLEIDIDWRGQGVGRALIQESVYLGAGLCA